MMWKSIDSQSDLNDFGRSVCWEDSQTLEFHATPLVESYFPNDVSRSGYRNLNLHVLLDACVQPLPILHIVFIDCDQTSLHFLMNLFVRGRVDALKRVNIENTKGEVVLRCSRVIYRFLAEDHRVRSAAYFQHDWSQIADRE